MNSYFEQCGDILKHISILFTHGEDLEGQTIAEFVKQSPKLQQLVEKCGGRSYVIDNKHWRKRWWGYRSNRVQVKKLLRTIENNLKGSEEGCFNNELLQMLEEEIKEEIESMDDNLHEEKKKGRAKENVYKKLLVRLAGVTTGTLIGAFLGICIAVAAVVALLKAAKFASAVKAIGVEAAALAGIGAAAGSGIAAGVLGAAALAGGVGGGITGYKVAEESDSKNTKQKGEFRTRGRFKQENMWCFFNLVFVFLMANEVSLQETVVGFIGGSAVLPCSSKKTLHTIQDITVLWRYKYDQNVYDIINGKYSEGQNQEYKNRAESFPKEYVKGNFSIKLNNLKHTDAGKYQCYIIHESEDWTVELRTEESPKRQVQNEGTKPRPEMIVLIISILCIGIILS
ncbi:hypothetical protein Q8A67_006163 [Cirrhinus molitorella]|uniref:Ig-like domain-containing protein n=1 Tax=Cirrhinus molitorella TaxID=172907 RepID=A0AA88TT96_9TELE|nr:hypothetical protein Q8A67_006163 [Cirrhinus molitorella]